MVLRGSLLLKDNPEATNLILGGISGCISRTIIAPFDKIKILMQFEQTKLPFRTFLKNNIKEEGFINLWRGNGTNLIRIFPFSGMQFVTYDFCKKNFANNEKVTNTERLIFGGLAGIVATSMTHPIDVIKHRVMCYKNINSMKEASIDIFRENGGRMINFYKGYGSTISSLVPFISLNFATFDLLKENLPDNIDKDNSVTILSLGGISALFSQTLCYPLDTIRRRMQNKRMNYKNGLDAGKQILKKEGVLSFYKGLVPNILRMVPNTAIRFSIFEKLKQIFLERN